MSETQKVFIHFSYIFCLVLLFLLPNGDVSAATFSSSIQVLSGIASRAEVGQQISFRIISSDGQAPFTSNKTDSFGEGASNGLTINSDGFINWTPQAQDIGTHNLTISLLDADGDTSTVALQIIVLSQLSVSIANVNPSSSVNVGQTVFFNVTSSGFTSRQYSISDSMSGSSLLSSSLNSSGNFSWTPKDQDVGSHTITVTITDADGRSAYANQNITVGTATAAISSLLPGTSVISRQPLTFTVTPTGFTNPTYAATDSVTGNSVGSITSTGNFTWIPTTNDLGEHTITIRVTDSLGNLATVLQKITVTKASLSTNLTNNSSTLKVGSSISVNLAATGVTSPTYTLIDSMNSASLSNKNINSDGVFSWTPTSNDLGQHSIKITGSDVNGNIAETTITIIVLSKDTSLAPTPLINSTTPKTQTTSSASKKYIFTRALSLGSTGTEVSELQKRLISLGFYNGPITVTFGPLTKAGVMKLQAKYKLVQVGNVGPATRKVLNSDI